MNKHESQHHLPEGADELDALLDQWKVARALSDQRASEIRVAVLQQVGVDAAAAGSQAPPSMWRPPAVFSYEWWATFSESMERALGRA